MLYGMLKMADFYTAEKDNKTSNLWLASFNIGTKSSKKNCHESYTLGLLHL